MNFDQRQLTAEHNSTMLGVRWRDVLVPELPL